MQLGAGGEVSLPAIPVVRVFPTVDVWTPTTRMSPAGMPFAFTVMEPPMVDEPSTLIWPDTGTAGAGSELMLGQPGSTGTMTTRSP